MSQNVQNVFGRGATRFYCSSFAEIQARQANARTSSHETLFRVQNDKCALARLFLLFFFCLICVISFDLEILIINRRADT